ncbi:50S ribosomal protein L6 [Candidatus Peregrinibacteria bacterium]|nr:50S ribosomal protein L6 [Candidatus Peregrinibacteria bacterium]
MSRIGKQPVPIPTGVQADIKGSAVNIKGPKGAMTLNVNPRIKIKIDGSNVIVERGGNEKIDRSLHGLTRTLINNAILGVTKGFSKQLDIQGVGYRVQLQGKNLEFTLGFSHPVKFPAPTGITFEIDKEKKNILTVSGIDKCLAGQTAADIRDLRKPEPYKGKGIRYVGEVVRRKAGKAATTAAKGAS